jgi:hypothetical protein
MGREAMWQPPALARVGGSRPGAATGDLNLHLHLEAGRSPEGMRRGVEPRST